MVTPVTFSDIADGVSTGASAAELINDTKRAVNDVINNAPTNAPTDAPTVLKGWTRTETVLTHLTGGVDMSSGDYNGMYIEFRNAKGQAGGGSGYINIQFRLSSGVLVPASTKSSEALLFGNSGTITGGTGDDAFTLFQGSFGLYSGSGIAELFSNPTKNIAAIRTNTVSINEQDSLFGSPNTLSISPSFYDDSETPSEVWLDGLSLPFQVDYRIMKKADLVYA